MKKHYHPMEALSALYKRQEKPDAVLFMRHVSPSAEKKIKRETIFLSDVSEWKVMDINCVKAHVLGTVATYKQLLHHFAVPDSLKETISIHSTSYTLRSNTLGFEIMNGSFDSDLMKQLRRMDARVVLSRLSDRGNIATRTIPMSQFRPAGAKIDLQPGEIPSHLIIPGEKQILG